MSQAGDFTANKPCQLTMITPSPCITSTVVRSKRRPAPSEPLTVPHDVSSPNIHDDDAPQVMNIFISKVSAAEHRHSKIILIRTSHPPLSIATEPRSQVRTGHCVTGEFKLAEASIGGLMLVIFRQYTNGEHPCWLEHRVAANNAAKTVTAARVRDRVRWRFSLMAHARFVVSP